MNPMGSAAATIRARRTRSSVARLAGIAGLILGLAPLGVQGQTAAQLAALARVGRARAATAPAIGVEASTVSLDQPSGLAVDSNGNLYLADANDEVVREVSVNGVISTVAGDGNEGFGGDGGPATSAQLDTPTGVAVDGNGNIYIADTLNNRIREVSGGTITTIAGTGVAGFSGDGGAAASAELDQPAAVAVDSKGNIYIADTDNNRIREISGGSINTVAGDGQQGYSGDGGTATAAALNSPTGLTLDGAFNIYIGDTANERVRMVTFATGDISTIAGTGVRGFNGDGSALSTELASPSGVYVDSSGTVYVADSDNNRIRTISGGKVTTIAGDGSEGFSGDGGPPADATLDTPRAVTVLGTAVFFSDTENNRVRTVTAGSTDTIAGMSSPSTESLVIGSAFSTVYGTGSLTSTFSNGGLTATGMVTFYDGEGASRTTIGQAVLSGNTATISTGTLTAGTHYITASYGGDAKNAPITSGVYVFVVTPVPLTAVANAASMLYGQAVPALSGTLNGVLTQDSGNVTAVFSTTVTSTSAPGSYPIAVALAGSAAGNYTVTLGGGSGSLTISKAPTTTKLQASTSTPVLGAAVTLTATVASTTSGTPTGTVNFFNGTTQLNATPAALSNGVATVTVTSLPVGALSLTAVDSGDADFTTSTSPPLTSTEASPDFNISITPASQSVLPFQSVNYTITATPVNSTFVYPVSLSVSGLPNGVTASFKPASIAAGAGASTSTLTLAANGLAQLRKNGQPFGGWPSSTALALLFLPLVFGKRGRKTASKLSRAGWTLVLLLALAGVSAIAGCGGGGFFGHTTQSYTVTVTAVSGPDTHTATVTLTVQ
jgi:Bacterial Ig-like domain (group 3)/MBG domain (YGX type)/NHL repeat